MSHIAHFAKFELVAPFTVAAFLIGAVSACDQSPTKGTQASTCEYGAPIKGNFYPRLDEVEMYVGPGFDFAKVVNEKATSSGQTVYATFGRDEVLAGHCVTSEWLQGKISEADGHSVDFDSGWVLRQQVASKMSEQQLAMARDRSNGLDWDIDAESDFSLNEKKLLRVAAFKILRDNPNCDRISDGYCASIPGEFYVTCSSRNGKTPFTVTFNLSRIVENH